MLRDLGTVIAEVKERIKAINLETTFEPDSTLWSEVVTRYQSHTTDAVKVAGNALVISTPNGNFLTISAQELPRVWAVLPYVRALSEYEGRVRQLALKMGFPTPGNQNAKKIFKLLPISNGETKLGASIFDDIIKHIKTDLGFSEPEQELFKLFLENGSWSGVTKTLERTDWLVSAVVIAGQWLANAASRRGELAVALADSKAFEAHMQSAIAEANSKLPTHIHQLESTSAEITDGGRNLIFYGAPGTGKSHRVDELTSGMIVTRTVFHPDTQNSDFFGALKPAMSGDNVTYTFQPGPLARAIVGAANGLQLHHYLVIEELNRAPAAAVFGELFQLLDRQENGAGAYAVDFPTPESAEWFKSQGYAPDKLILPQNLSIYATMNSADQGVYPLDTAFRRRWEQIYLPLYDAQKGSPSGKIRYRVKGDIKEIEWMSFVMTLNGFLQEHFDFPEDRLLGPWFVKSHELSDSIIPPKVILYLVDDLLRHDDKSKLFSAGLKHYGAIDRALDNNEIIFSADFLSRLEMETLKGAPIAISEDAPAGL